MPAEYCPTYFVTGTDTGIGKTWVTAAMARFFADTGLKVGVMKPIETGVGKPEELGEDAKLLRWASQSTDAEEDISPFRFTLASAPSLAAEKVGIQIDRGRIENSLNKIRQGKDLVFVEGAGGLMVPIQGGYLMADLAKTLDLPLLLITTPKLGTINHTLLTTFAANAMALELVGFIINRMPQVPDEAVQNAPHQLAALASAELLGVLPETIGTPMECIEQLAKAVGEMRTMEWLKRKLKII